MISYEGSHDVAKSLEICEAGYFCEAASFDQAPCLDVSTFCPKDSARPTPVTVGHRTIQDIETGYSVSEVLCSPGTFCEGGRDYPCVAGTYGSETGLSERTCTAPCPAGFYCPLGSSTPTQCGSSALFCPFGSSEPIPVSRGYYTTQ
eukprot:g423.t1